MKKLALLLGSLLVVTATQAKEVVVAPVEAEKEVVVVAEPVVEEVAVVEEAAAPTLKLTGLKTGIWNENRTGRSNGDLGSSTARLYLDFAYGEDWTFNVAVRRYFDSNTKYDDANKGLFNQGTNRVYVGATKKLNDQYSLGYTYIAKQNVDVHDIAFNFAPTEYLNGYLTYEYNSKAADNQSDSHYVEFQPKLSWNGWGISYYYEAEFAIEDDSEYQIQQVRLFTPAVEYGNYAASLEYRGTLSHETKDEKGVTTTGEVAENLKDAFDVNRVYLYNTYKLNDSTTLFGNLGYELGTWEMDRKGTTKDSDVIIVEAGVSYKF